MAINLHHDINKEEINHNCLIKPAACCKGNYEKIKRLNHNN